MGLQVDLVPSELEYTTLHMARFKILNVMYSARLGP